MFSAPRLREELQHEVSDRGAPHRIDAVIDGDEALARQQLLKTVSADVVDVALVVVSAARPLRRDSEMEPRGATIGAEMPGCRKQPAPWLPSPHAIDQVGADDEPTAELENMTYVVDKLFMIAPPPASFRKTE